MRIPLKQAEDFLEGKHKRHGAKVFKLQFLNFLCRGVILENAELFHLITHLHFCPLSWKGILLLFNIFLSNFIALKWWCLMKLICYMVFYISAVHQKSLLQHLCGHCSWLLRFPLCIFLTKFLSSESFFFWSCTLLNEGPILMQHYDRRGQYDLALAKIDEAMEHTPTVIDLYSVKVCCDFCVILLSIF